jgi:hypothetical protein
MHLAPWFKVRAERTICVRSQDRGLPGLGSRTCFLCKAHQSYWSPHRSSAVFPTNGSGRVKPQNFSSEKRQQTLTRLLYPERPLKTEVYVIRPGCSGVFHRSQVAQCPPLGEADHLLKSLLITQSISKRIDTPRNAVFPDASNGGETSTRSAPTMFTPSRSRATCKA